MSSNRGLTRMEPELRTRIPIVRSQSKTEHFSLPNGPSRVILNGLYGILNYFGRGSGVLEEHEDLKLAKLLLFSNGRN